MNLQCPDTYWILNDDRFIPIAEKVDEVLSELLVAYFRYNKDPENYWKVKDEFDAIIDPLKEEFGTTEDVEVVKFLFKYRFNNKSGWDKTSEDHLYFIESEDGYVKIGRSVNPESRFSSIQSGNHQKLKLTKVFENRGDYEGMLHDKFKHLNKRGEWFKMTDEIREFIKEKEDE